MEIKIVWSGKLKLHVDVWSIARFKLFFSNSVIFIMWLMDICKVKTDSWNKMMLDVPR